MFSATRLKPISLIFVAGIIATIGAFSQDAPTPTAPVTETVTEPTTIFTGAFETELRGPKWRVQLANNEVGGTPVTVVKLDTVKRTITVIVKADGKTLETGFAEITRGTIEIIANAMIPVKPGVPFDRTVTHKDGRKLEVTVLGRNPKKGCIDPCSIQARRMTDGVEVEIFLKDLAREDRSAVLQAFPRPTDKLAAATPEEQALKFEPKLSAKELEQKKTREEKAMWKTKANNAFDLWHKTKKKYFSELAYGTVNYTKNVKGLRKDAERYNNLLIARDPTIMPLLAHYEGKENTHNQMGHSGGYDKGARYVAWYDIDQLKSLKFNYEEAETISLRPQFEKFGIKSIHQTPEGCEKYAGYSLACYLLQKDGKPKPTFAAYNSAFTKSGTSGQAAVVAAIGQLAGKKPTVAYIPADLGYEYQIAWVKHYLRKGIPLLMGYRDEKAKRGHRVVATGFSDTPIPKEGTSGVSIEYLDSYGTSDGDGGYHYRWLGEYYAVWLE